MRTPAWITEAADRAERRAGNGFQSHPTPAQQVNALIAAILDRKVSRADLQRLAKSMAEGKS